MDGDGRLEHKGYRVIPAALRDAQKTYEITAAKWTTLHTNMGLMKLGDNDLGLIGRLAGVITRYNAAVDTIAGKLQTGAENMRGASDALNSVATAYEAQDEQYYAKFGWIENQMDGVAPPPG